MKHIYLFILIFISFFYTQNRNNSNPIVGIFSTNVYSDSLKKQVLEIKTQVLYDDLSFIKNDNSFSAKYELRLQILTLENEILDSKIYIRDLTVSEFSQTNSKNLKSEIVTYYNLAADKYIIRGEIRDVNSNKKNLIEHKSELINSVGKKIIINNLKFYEIDSLNNRRMVDNRSFNNDKGIIQISFNINKFDNNPDNDIYYKVQIVRANQSEVVTKFINDTLINNKTTTYLVNLDKIELKASTLNLKIIAYNNKLQIDEVSSSFNIFWNLYPNNTDDMAIALEQSRYIMDSDSLEFYKFQPLSKSQNYFKNFWRNKSIKNTETDANEMMIEYYKRVQIAIRNFSSFNSNGWITDRGRIYIKMGPPDEALDYPWQQNSKAYVVWSYYKDRKQFIFVDYTGFNDYRLTDESRQYEFQ